MKILSAILSAIILNIFSANPVSASIIYSGDLSLTGPEFNIDIDNNGSVDISAEWSQRGYGSNGAFSSSYDTNLKFDVRFLNNRLTGSETFPGSKAPLGFGTVIGETAPDNLMWSYNSNDGMLWTSRNSYSDPIEYSGIWHNLDARYLGFELAVDAELYYGWIHLVTDSENNISLIDYAYQDTPSTSLLAGVSSVPLPGAFWLFISGLVSIRLISKNA